MLNFSTLLIFTLVSEREGFGINTNILETNVLNLVVVIGILVYFGKDILQDSLKARKENILKSVQDSVEKKMQAAENLSSAKLQLENAKLKANDIRSQGIILAQQNSEKLLQGMAENIKRLEETKNFTIRFEEEKAITEVCKKVSSSVLKQALVLLKDRLNSKLCKKITLRKLDLLSTLTQS
jgi:F-type H+-transporting ATPase subunit b